MMTKSFRSRILSDSCHSIVHWAAATWFCFMDVPIWKECEIAYNRNFHDFV
jgi:hypothetical protein